MSPLNIEVYNQARQDWVKTGERVPGDLFGSVSHNNPDGTREIYLFGCNPDDGESVIYQSKAGVDFADQVIRIIDTEGCDEVARLREGESYALSLKTDIVNTRDIRFTHKADKIADLP